MAKDDLREYTVKAGECIASIAAKLGVLFDDIWGIEANRALRELRQDPYVLAEGDKVMVPRPKRHGRRLATGRRHVVQVKPPHVDFQVRVIFGGKPRANLDYKVTLTGSPIHIFGTSNDEGLVRARIPATATGGLIEFADGRTPVRFLLGALDPWNTMSGVQGRLLALGYPVGEVDGVYGPHTARAIRRFEEDHQRPICGVADEATMAAIRDAYGR